MTLSPISPISKRHDPGFNEKAAKAAYELVMKMDEDEARVFMEFVVADVLEQTIEDNQRALQSHLDRVVAKRIDLLKRATLSAVSKVETPKGIAFGEALASISKDFVEREHPRADNGTFKTKIHHNPAQTKHIHQTTAEAMGIKHGDDFPHLTEAQKIQYQQEYTQLANFLQSVRNSTKNPGDVDVFLHYKDKDSKGRVNPNGALWTTKVSGVNIPSDAIDVRNKSLIGVEARPGTLNVGGAAFGLSSALGASGSTAGMRTQKLNRYEAAFPDFRDTWLAETNPRYSNEKLYNRVSSGSALIGALSDDPRVKSAAAFGEFVGSHGPEAEKVIGPTARKTAYRYRGTSKPPDKALVLAYERGIYESRVGEANDPFRNTPEGHRANLKNPANLSNAQIAQRRARLAYAHSSFEERAGGRVAVYNYLMDEVRKPSQQLYELQLASGNTPPSEGVLINAEGKIVDQAVGYGDDHYLPFNLKNLKQLRGGEYIRTRSVGGLTSEDVYTGLMAGARQVTVVSRSGTFTLTFAPDFKGGRRYNDKARRMTRRYEQLLDAVQSEKVQRKGIDPQIRNDFARQVREEYPGEPPSAIRELIEEKVEEYKSSPELSNEDMARIDRITDAAMASDPSRDAKEFRAQLTQRIMMDKKHNYALDGEGYQAAAQALQEQFPYYITAHSVPIDERELLETHKDKGYVEPGRNRPTAARAGLFGTKINTGDKVGEGKFSASQANYQGWHPAKGETGNTPDEPDTDVAGGKLKSKNKVNDSVKRIIQQRAHARAANDLYEALKVQGITENTKAAWPFLKDDESFNLAMNSPSGAVEMDKFVRALEGTAGINTQVKSAIEQYKRSAGDIEAKSFEPTLGLKWSAKPYEFGGVAYQIGADDNIRAAEVRRINERTSSVLFGGNLSSLTEKQMKEEVEALADVYRIVGENPELKDKTKEGAEARRAIQRGLLGKYNQEAIVKLLAKPDKIDRKLEDVHRMRALKALGGWSDATVQQHTGRAPEAPETPQAIGPSSPGVSLIDQANADIQKRELLGNQIKGLSERIFAIPDEKMTEAQWELWDELEKVRVDDIVNSDLSGDELSQVVNRITRKARQANITP